VLFFNDFGVQILLTYKSLISGGWAEFGSQPMPVLRTRTRCCKAEASGYLNFFMKSELLIADSYNSLSTQSGCRAGCAGSLLRKDPRLGASSLCWDHSITLRAFPEKEHSAPSSRATVGNFCIKEGNNSFFCLRILAQCLDFY
jgi:hypothetical protein